MRTITVTPAQGLPGRHLRLSGAGLSSKAKTVEFVANVGGVLGTHTRQVSPFGWNFPNDEITIQVPRMASFVPSANGAGHLLVKDKDGNVMGSHPFGFEQAERFRDEKGGVGTIVEAPKEVPEPPPRAASAEEPTPKRAALKEPESGFVVWLMPLGKSKATRMILPEGEEIPAPGTQVFVAGVGQKRDFYVQRILPWVCPKPIPNEASVGERLSAKVTEVSAWCDHMPGCGPNCQYLIVSLELENHAKDPLLIQFGAVFVSEVHENRLGKYQHKISIRDSHSGRPSGRKECLLPPGEKQTVQLRGNGVYSEGLHEETLWVTVMICDRTGSFVVRGSGLVRPTC